MSAQGYDNEHHIVAYRSEKILSLNRQFFEGLIED